MNIYHTKAGKLPGTNYKEVYIQAMDVYKKISKKTKRKPYIRSKYFNGEKVFFDLFWSHLRQKNLKDRTRRLKFFPCAIELIEKSTVSPDVSGNKPKAERLYRFFGISKEKEAFVVQIKKDKKNGKFLMSIYPK